MMTFCFVVTRWGGGGGTSLGSGTSTFRAKAFHREVSEIHW